MGSSHYERTDTSPHMHSTRHESSVSSVPGPGTTEMPAPVTQDSRQPQSGLAIRVSSGVGEGATRLAAFDAALRSAGVGDFNLLRLSSVIPPQSEVSEVRADDQLRGGHGDLLYCVYADAYASTAGEQAWAGLAWSRRVGEPGGGLFVEHTGAVRSDVEHDLRLTLDDLSRGRDGAFRPAGQLLASARCVGRPVCAVVVASYRSESWSTGRGR